MKSRYTSNEKLARALLIKSKQMARKMDDQVSKKSQQGYLLVIARMNQLLQEKFPYEDATLRYLESEEFKDFTRSFNRIMSDIQNSLSAIERNTGDIGIILKKQVSVMDQHFSSAAQDRRDGSLLY